MFYIFIHIVFIWKCSGYQTSERLVTWNGTDSECRTPLRSLSFSPDVKDELSRSIPSNEKFWIRAKSIPTKYLIWKGCYQVQTDMRWLEYTKLEHNSITNCFKVSSCQHRMGSYIALKGDMCTCVHNVKRYFTSTRQIPDQYCKENLNEECGCPNNTYSLYELTNTVSSSQDGDCCIHILRWNKIKKKIDTHAQNRRCDDSHVTDTYSCWNGTESLFFTDPHNVTWSQARRRCEDRGLKLGHGSSKTRNFSMNTAHWVAIRRSFSLAWNIEKEDSGDDDRLCVALLKDGDGKLHLSENGCQSKYRAICVISNVITEKRGFPIWTVIVPTVVVLCCVLIAVLVVINRRINSMRKPTLSVNNRFYDQVVCSSIKAKDQGQTGGVKESKTQESAIIYHNIDTDKEFVNPTNEGVYVVKFTLSNSNKVSPKSDNLNDKCNSNAKDALNSATNKENKEGRTISLQTRPENVNAQDCIDRNQYETIFVQTSL